MPDTFYLCLDPGKTTGWATFEESGAGITMGQVNTEELIEMLKVTSAKVIITEDYRLFPWKAKEQIWSKMDTVRIIGMIQLWCYLHNLQLILQDSNIKSIGYMWAGLKKAGSHKNSHERDAYVHGVYYLQKAGIRKPQQGVGN